MTNKKTETKTLKTETKALKETMHRFAEITAWMRYCCYGSSKIKAQEKPKND